LKTLVISCHPDDETLGCGATLIKARENGHSIFWVIATQGYEPVWSSELIEKKTREVEHVAAAYGVERFFPLRFPAGGLEGVPIESVMRGIGQVAAAVKPDTVYIIHGGDVHTDHQMVFQAAMSVFKPFHMSGFNTKKLLCYETLSSTECAPSTTGVPFVPTVFNDVTAYMDHKIEIMMLYETELQADPLPRGPSAIRALARFRGSTIGVEFAEAFVLLREVI